MKATIYHNPNCGTSRRTLEALQARPDVDLTIVDYLRDPPTSEELARLYARAGISPRDGLRAKEAKAAELAVASDEELLEAMVADPILIERPLVETEKGVRLCRPSERVEELL
jgi:arsenate reductase